DAAEVLFRFAVSVLHRGVEVVHAGRDGARDGALLVARVAAHHQFADRTAAEAQHREPHPGAPKRSHVHRDFLRLLWCLVPLRLAEAGELVALLIDALGEIGRAEHRQDLAGVAEPLADDWLLGDLLEFRCDALAQGGRYAGRAEYAADALEGEVRVAR